MGDSVENSVGLEQGNALEVRVNDFGPIREGAVRLGDLAIFIGPNGSGKSYISTLLYAMIRARHYVRGNPLRGDEPWQRVDDDSITELTKILLDSQPPRAPERVRLPTEKAARIFSLCFAGPFGRALERQIARSFASPASDLIRRGASKFEISARLAFAELSMASTSTGGARLEAFSLRGMSPTYVSLPDASSLSHVAFRGDGINIAVGDVLEDPPRLAKTIAGMVETWLSVRFPRVFYLPASRSGLLQNHRVLAAGLFERAPFGLVDPPEAAVLPAVTSDLVSLLLLLKPDQKGPLHRLATELEREVLRGEIAVTSSDVGSSAIDYKERGQSIPLSRVSTSVTEIAPLILFMRHYLGYEDTLIIEEPEAHLHPENQRILTKYLVKLVRSGVRVIVTTHSDYILEQLSSYIMLSQIDPEDRSRIYGRAEDEHLKPDEVSAHLFCFDQASEGYRIRDIEVTAEDGISQEEFVRVNEALYDESIKLRRAIAEAAEEPAPEPKE